MKYIVSALLLGCCFAQPLLGQYTIDGKVNLGEDWQPKIYLAAVNKLSDYYRTSPDMIVNTAPIAADGTFILDGDNLPDRPQFYRVYLMKKQNTDFDVCLYVGEDDHNFAHVILKNGDQVSLTAHPNSIAPFGEYSIEGNVDNQMMRALARVVFPRFYFHRIKFPTELKFSEDKLHTDLINFADTCSNTLVSLAAVTNTDFDEYFDRDIEFYQSFASRLKSTLPNSIYTKNYLLKLQYYANQENTSVLKDWLLWIMGSLLLVSLYLLNQYRQRYQALSADHKSSAVATLNLSTALTQKEREILGLIHEGKSNKEIASTLYVEVSTVKSHINKLYSKIGASSRREAQSIANQLLNK